MKYLSKENVNTGRQPEIDMLKAFAIIAMVLVHTFQSCGTDAEGVGVDLLGIVAGLLGSGGFMVCMGIGMRYARRHTEILDAGSMV